MTDRKVKFYVNPKLVDKSLKHAVIMFPFWGIPSFDDSPFMAEVFKTYSFDTNYYELVSSLQDSDFVLVPYRYNVLKSNNRLDILDAYLKEAREHGKPILIDGCSDLEEPIPFEDVYALRVGGYKFSKKETDITIPFYADDLLARHYGGNLVLREKVEVPTVGFVGWASMPLLQKIKTVLKELFVREVYKKGIFFREETIKVLQSSRLIKSNFIIRTSYSGHVNTAKSDPQTLRKEFVENMFNSDYALAVKGDGNFSVRFYEALSLGRIPLLIDTECVLGFEDIIDYDKFIFRIDFRDIKKADKLLREFNDSITDEQFKEMQKMARQAYLEYMRPDRMSKRLMSKLVKIADKYTKR